MKRIIIIFSIIVITIAILFIVLLICYKNTSWNNVSVQIKDGTLTTTGATFIIKNKNLFKYTNDFNSNFFIDEKDGSKWSDLTTNTYLKQGAYYEVKPSHIYEININWEHKYGTLLEGKTYRIRFEPQYYNSYINDSAQFIIEFTI